MEHLPDLSKVFEYENNFYLSCDSSRVSKIIAHYELFKRSVEVPGIIVECGVFKGASLSRWGMFRELLMSKFAKKIVAFDSFDLFPDTNFDADGPFRDAFIDTHGKTSITKEQITKSLEMRGLGHNVELVRGNICDTVPEYLANHPELKISFLNIDTDVYEPARTALECFYDRVSEGGIVILDDYGWFPGETQAADEFLKARNAQIRKLPFSATPCYLVKEKD